MIVVVSVFAVYFHAANGKQRRTQKVIENTVSVDAPYKEKNLTWNRLDFDILIRA